MTLTDYFIPLTAYVKTLRPGTDTRPQQTADAIEGLIERARTQALHDGVAPTTFQQALFPVAAWADEHLACTGVWPERHDWQDFLLQRRHFKTRLAGREFFERLDQLAPDDGELREVYLLCLCLGFQGRYGTAAQADELTELRLAQYRLLQQRDRTHGQNSQILFPSAYRQGGQAARRPRGLARHLSWRRLLFIILPPLILVAIAIAMHASLTHDVQLFREAIHL